MLLDSVEWLGHAGFRIRAGRRVVYIDPYRVAAGPEADLILITHGHYDHFSLQDVERLSNEHTLVVAPPAVAERVGGRVASLAPGEAIDDPLDVRAVAAYNTSKRDPDGNLFHPREAGGVGYVLNVRGEHVYHSGDTDVIPEMDQVAGVDLALLAVSGVYVMTAAEAAEAARRIGPRMAVPMHWGEHIGTRADAEEFAESAPVEVTILDRADGPDA
jgi:L-ascorbate metabolism protein UlaG (beta-lactamase superfamily)